MTRTRDEGFLSIKKVEEDKMNKMTIRKKAMLLVAAGMAMQSMGLTVYAKEITEPTDFTSTVKQTQSKEDVLADAIIQAQDAVKSKKALLLEAKAELDKVQPKYDATKQVYEKASYASNQIESSANEAVLDAMKSNLQDIKNKKEDLDQVTLEKEKAETVKTDLAAKVKTLEKSLEQLTMEYTKLNSEKDKVDTIVACYNNLKDKKLDTEVYTIDGYESICTLLKQYKTALLDLNEKEQVYQEVKDKFDVVNTAYQKAKAGYDQAVIQETNTKNDLKKHLEESNKEVEKKENDTKQSSSVNTGVETAIAGFGMITMLGAAGAVVATRKLSRKEKHAKK